MYRNFGATSKKYIFDMQECCAVYSHPGPMYVHCFLSSLHLLLAATTAMFYSLLVISPLLTTTEPEFVKSFRSPGIHSKESIPQALFVKPRAGLPVHMIQRFRGSQTENGLWSWTSWYNIPLWV